MKSSRWLIAGLAFVSLCAAAPTPAPKLQRVFRWTPGRGTEAVASLDWKFRVFGTSNLVAPGGVILWHFGQETADFVGLAPWRIDLETGRGQPLRQEAFFSHEISAQWLPGGKAAAVNPQQIEVRSPAGQSLQTKVARLPVFLSAIHDASPHGLLLDGGRFYDLASGKVLPHPQPSGDPIEGQRFSPDGSWLAGLRGGTVRGPATVGSHLVLPLPWRDYRLGSDGTLYWLEDPS